MDPVNPLLATQQITLKDGVPRGFCWDFGAIILMEDASRADKAKALGFNASRALRNMIWAGLNQDAVDRGEEWTLRKVETLMPTSSKGMEQLHIQVNALIEAARSGESQPAVAGAKRVPARNHGGKRRKR